MEQSLESDQSTDMDAPREEEAPSLEQAQPVPFDFWHPYTVTYRRE